MSFLLPAPHPPRVARHLPRRGRCRADRVVRPYKDLLSIDQSLALDLRRMEVLAFTVFVGREMTAIIKIACGA